MFVREWAHYRWGVFGEAGCPHDHRYPSHYYRDDRDVVASACVNGTLDGHFWQVSSLRRDSDVGSRGSGGKRDSTDRLIVTQFCAGQISK